MNEPIYVYAAGPDVFDPAYPAIKQAIKDACRAAGLVALCPADDEIHGDGERPLSQRIQEANLAMIDRAHVVMANVRNFRGLEPDSGTVFESGYARGKGKPVWCYNVPTSSLLDQVPQGSPGRDLQGHVIEDFGLGRNLMLAHGCFQVSGGADECIAQIAAWSRQQYSDHDLAKDDVGEQPALTF